MPAHHRNALSVAAGWDEEREARLTKLWKDGLSCGGIAKVLGVTRNSVIGKARRMKLPPHSAAVQQSNRLAARGFTPQPGRQRAPRVARAIEPGRGDNVRVRLQPDPVPLPPATFVDVTTAKPWTERRFGECAFPVSGDGADVLSCCAKVIAERSYCAAHAKIMFRPVKRRRKADRPRVDLRRWAA